MCRRPPRPPLLPSTPLSRSSTTRPSSSTLSSRAPPTPAAVLSPRRCATSRALTRTAASPSCDVAQRLGESTAAGVGGARDERSEEHTAELQSPDPPVCRPLL